MNAALTILGFTLSGNPVLGGAFQLADTHGIPLWFTLEQAKVRGWVISLLDYMSAAIAHGWDDTRALAHIRESYVDSGLPGPDMGSIRDSFITVFMAAAEQMPGMGAREVAAALSVALDASQLRQD